jgi:carbon starvation protein CstA
MFDTPKRTALFTVLAALVMGILFATVTRRQSIALSIVLGFLIGTVWGAGVFAWWRRKESRGKSFSLGWFLISYLVMALGGPVGLPLEASFGAAGYGLALWVGMQLWERRRKKPLSWSDLNPKQEE